MRSPVAMLYYTKKLLNNGKECIFRSPVGMQDASSLLALSSELLLETGYIQPMSDQNADAETEAAFLELAAESSDHLILIAEMDGCFVGSACLMRIEEEDRSAGEIGIAVLKEDWGLGIGSHFLRLLIRKAASCGYSRLRLHVKPDNVRAQKLYLKFGFMTEDIPLSPDQPIEMILHIK